MTYDETKQYDKELIRLFPPLLGNNSLIRKELIIPTSQMVGYNLYQIYNGRDSSVGLHISSLLEFPTIENFSIIPETLPCCCIAGHPILTEGRYAVTMGGEFSNELLDKLRRLIMYNFNGDITNLYSMFSTIKTSYKNIVASNKNNYPRMQNPSHPRIKINPMEL